MLIGELASRSGLPARTIRFYEKVGILADPGRTPAGYRDYGDDAVERLGFVRAAQGVGLTLAEVAEVLALRDLGEAPCERVAALVDRKAAEVTERIAALRRLEADLRRLADRIAAAPAPGPHRGAAICPLIEG